MEFIKEDIKRYLPFFCKCAYDKDEPCDMISNVTTLGDPWRKKIETAWTADGELSHTP